jgi:phage shock protein A
MTSSEPDPPPVPEVVDAEIVESVPAEPAPADYTEAGVPTFDFVRDRIEGRVATARGREELDAETPEGRTLAQQEADRDAAARERLEQIRRSMGGG